MQTGIVDKVPIICVNKKYWKGLFNWLEKNPEKENMFIHNNDIRLLYLVDEIDEVINIIKN